MTLTALASCNKKDAEPEDTENGTTAPSHVHTFAEAWEKDDLYHWHAATCEHTDEVSEKAAHTYVDGACSVCGKEQPDEQEEEICRHTFSDEWTSDKIYHWHAATCEHTEEIKDRGAHTYVDGVCSTCQAAMPGTPAANLKYRPSGDGTYYIVSGIGDCKDTDIFIPEVHNELPVKAIDNFAFYECKDLTSITLPACITSIGREAFSGCVRLESIAIPDGVETIGERAFSNCRNLTLMVLPKSLTKIGDSVFSNCESLVDLTIPFVGASRDATNADNTTHFFYIFGTSEENIPASVKRVTVTGGPVLASAFFKCQSLTSVVLPDDLTAIADQTFSNCTELTSIIIPARVTSIGNSAFVNCPKLTSIVIPKEVTSIGKRAFGRCRGLTSIRIPKNVTEIGDEAFDYCSGLTGVDITDLSAWCKISFGYDTANPLVVAGKLYLNGTLVTDLVIPSDVTNISNVFTGYTELTSVTLSEGVVSIGDYAFSGCTKLASATIPQSVKSIGKKAFYQCDQLKSVTVPETVESIGEKAFYQCAGLKSLSFSQDIKNIGDYAFSECIGLESVIMSKSVGTIGNYAFYKCDQLKAVTMPETVESIGEKAFYQCVGLKSLSFSQGIKSIGDYAFSECINLRSLYIANTLTNLGFEAFYGCTALKSVTMAYTNNVGFAFNGCEGISFSMLSGNETDWGFGSCDWLKSITLPEGITEIPNSVFSYCHNLSSVSLPNGLKSIGKYAFYGCGMLKSITIPGSVTKIAERAFDSTGLTSVTVPKNATIDSEAFPYGCKITKK